MPADEGIGDGWSPPKMEAMPAKISTFIEMEAFKSSVHTTSAQMPDMALK
jgi:hypothetical protein